MRTETGMKNKKISREDFLKYAEGIVAGVLALRIDQLFKPTQDKNRGSLKEAKYYKRTDQLAG